MALNDIQLACTGSALAIGAPVRGWREWTITGGMLRGAQGGVWQPGTNTAECRGKHAAMLRVLDDALAAAGLSTPLHRVERWCTCGLYSWRRPDRIRARSTKIAGVIESWGRVLVGEHGYRAQYARVVAVCGPWNGAGDVPPPRDQRVAVAERYGVRYFETVDAAVAHFDDRR